MSELSESVLTAKTPYERLLQLMNAAKLRELERDEKRWLLAREQIDGLRNELTEDTAFRKEQRANLQRDISSSLISSWSDDFLHPTLQRLQKLEKEIDELGIEQLAETVKQNKQEYPRVREAAAEILSQLTAVSVEFEQFHAEQDKVHVDIASKLQEAEGRACDIMKHETVRRKHEFILLREQFEEARKKRATQFAGLLSQFEHRMAQLQKQFVACVQERYESNAALLGKIEQTITQLKHILRTACVGDSRSD